MTDRAVDRLARMLAKVRTDVRALQLEQRAGRTAFVGSQDEYDVDDNLVSRTGQQHDGTHGSVIFDGPIPPVPTAPLVEVAPGLLTVTWDGQHADGMPSPLDLLSIEVYASQEPFEFIEGGILVGSLVGEDGGQVTVSVVPAVWHVGLVAVSRAGKRSRVSARTMVEVTAPADGQLIQEAIDAGVAAQEAADAASEAAAAAAGLASSKGKVIISDTAPSGADAAVGNLWIKTPDNVPHTWSGSAWVARTDKAALDAAAAASNAQTAANNAAVSASAARASADGAITWSTAVPSGTPSNPNAIWMRRDSSGRVIGQWQWTGSAWASRTIDNALIANLDAGKINVGTLSGDRIDINTLSGKILQGGTVRTSDTVGAVGGGQGVIFDSSGIRAYNSAGTQTANFGADGSAWINGAFQTAPSGPRLHLFQTTNGGALRIYTDDANDLNYGALNLVRDIQAQTRELWMSLTGNNNGTRHGLVRLGETITAITQNHNASNNQAAAFYVTRDGSYEGVCREPGGSIRSLFYGRYNGDFNIGGGGAGRITLNKAGNTLVINKDDGHRIHLDANGWTYAYGVGLSVQGALTVSGSKNFVMPHPDGSDRMLKHASTESPHNGVEYWSQEPATVGDDGSCWVDLPDYFGPLTSIRGRAVFLTAHSPDAGLWSEEVGSDGFRVYGAPGARFSWLVKARRVQHDADGVDQLAFDVEYDRSDSAGDGGVAPIEPEPTVQVEPPSDEIE